MKSLMQGRKALSLLVLGGCLVQFNTASAGPMQVTAEIADFCELGTASTVAFGLLTPGSGVAGATTGTIEWRCSLDTTAFVAIDAGVRNDRTMINGAGDFLAYELYKEAAYTNVWGDTGADRVTVLGTGIDPDPSVYETVDVYGLVTTSAIDAAAVGNYSDTVNVTISLTP
jgi:spore coat protein U-like protein